MEPQRTQRIREEHKGLPQTTEAVGARIVDAAVAVHRALGPGLLESAYEACLAHELTHRDSKVLRQQVQPLMFDSIKIDAGYRIDLLVDDFVIVEVKAVESLVAIHEAQLLTYMKLSGLRLGFLINFNVTLLKHGIKRMIL